MSEDRSVRGPQATPAPLPDPAALAELLRQVTGESSQWAAQVTAGSRLEDDLQLDSVELAALAELLQRRYGTGVDLVAYLRGLDLDELIALTVGDLVDHLTATAKG